MLDPKTSKLRAQLAEYIASTSPTGSKRGLGSNGVCCFQHDESGMEIVVELPERSDVLYFYSPICRVPYEHTEQFFEKVLENNLHGVANRQASFGLDAKTQNMVLTFSIAMRHVDSVSFGNILNNFARIAEQARENTTKWIEELAARYSTSGEYSPETDSTNNNDFKLKV